MAFINLRVAGLIIADALRMLSGPSVFDMRPTSVEIVQKTWSGGRRGNGRSTEIVVLALPNYTKVRQVTSREIASSGGRYEEGDLVIGPITPAYPSLPHGYTEGYTETQLVPRVAGQGQEIIYRMAQQSGATGIVGDMYLVEFKRDRVMRFELVVGRLRTTPGP